MPKGKESQGKPSNETAKEKELVFMEGANKVTEQIQQHLQTFSERCDIGRSHFESALLLREHEQLEGAALKTYSTASQLLRTAEQLIRSGSVDRDKVRETTKKLDTLWQGLTLRLNSHKEALSYSVSFHQKLEQVTAWLCSWQAAIESQQGQPVSPESMSQLQRQGEVLAELYKGLTLDSTHLLQILKLSKMYREAMEYITQEMCAINARYCSVSNTWSEFRGKHSISNKVRSLEQQCSKVRGLLDHMEEEYLTPHYDITTSLEVLQTRLNRFTELDKRLDIVYSEQESIHSTVQTLGHNDHAKRLLDQLSNHWEIFQLKKQQCEQYLVLTIQLYTHIRDVEANIRTLRHLIKSHKAQATNETYNEFQTLKSSVLQRSGDICRRGCCILGIIEQMKLSLPPKTLDKPAQHIQIVIQKFKGADSVVRELRLQRVENVKKSEIQHWISIIGEKWLKGHADIGATTAECERLCSDFSAFKDEVSGIAGQVEGLGDAELTRNWGKYNAKFSAKHEQILLAKRFFTQVDEYHQRFKVSQDALTVDQLPDDVNGTDNMLAQCVTEPKELEQIFSALQTVFTQLETSLSAHSESVLQTRMVFIEEIMDKMRDLHLELGNSWKDRQMKLSKGLELRKFEHGIKTMYLWISNEGDQFLKANSHFSINIDKLGKTMTKYAEFDKQVAVEQQRLSDLCNSCQELKDCIIFNNGAIDSKMEAAQRAWTMFNDKLTCRKKLLSTADDIDQIVAQLKDELKHWKSESDKLTRARTSDNKQTEITLVHDALQHLQQKITEQKRIMTSTTSDTVYTTLATEQVYVEKFVRNVHHHMDEMLRESREIDNLLVSRTSSLHSLSSITSSGSYSSDSKMSVTSDESSSSRQPEAKLNGFHHLPSGKPPVHHRPQQQQGEHSAQFKPKVPPHRPISINSDSGILGSNSSDVSQSRWSWPEDHKSERSSPSVPPDSQPETPTGVPDKLSRVVEELLKSEEDFVKGLAFIVTQYMDQLSKHKVWDQRHILLGNIEEIYSFHQKHFLPELLKCKGRADEVAKVFLKHQTRYDLHVEYCRNKTHSEALYAENEIELEQIQKLLNQSLSLSSFLIKPVQRITKYQLLLAEMLRYSKAAGSDTTFIHSAHNVMLEVPRKANNLMHLEMFEDPPADCGALVHQDSMTVMSGGALMQGQGKVRQVFLFDNCLVFAKHELEGKRLQCYTRKTVMDLHTTTVQGDANDRFTVQGKTNNTVKFCCVTSSVSQREEWVKLMKEAIESSIRYKQDTAVKAEDRISVGSNEEPGKKGLGKFRSSLRFKRRKSLTKLHSKEDTDSSDYGQPYITANRLQHSVFNTQQCINKLSNISMSIDHINLLPSEEVVKLPEDHIKPTVTQSGYTFTDILFYGHFSLFCMCRHERTGLKFTAQITPVVDRQFYRSVQREVDILKVLNYKRVNRLHEIILDYEDCVILILSYQHQLYLLDFIQLKGVHREFESAEVVSSVLDGMLYLHARSIAHLDIKPENLIWDKTTVKIINFELGHYVDDGESVYLEPSMLDDEFGAPELLCGHASTLSADIWSVGVLAYLLLYSESPYYCQGKVLPPANRTFEASKYNDSISDHALIFLSSVLQNDARRRPSAQGCLNSLWIKSSTTRTTGSCLDKAKIARFCQRRRREAATRHIDIPESVLQELGLDLDML